MSGEKKDDFVVQMPYDDESAKRPGLERQSSSSSSYPGLAAPSSSGSAIVSKIQKSPVFAVLAYCLSSMSMTIVNKYVVSGVSWNLNFLYLAAQSFIATVAIVVCKNIGLVKDLTPFDSRRARTCTHLLSLSPSSLYSPD